MKLAIDLIIKKYDINKSQTIWVGFSGGADSLALLHILKVYKDLQVNAIHVNHSISEKSDLWQKHCENICHRLNVPLVVEHVNLEPPYKNGLEYQARQARYQAILKHVKDDFLFLAHHLDDQVETLMQRLIKGHRVANLSGIRELRMDGCTKIIRPFLAVRKQDLLKYLDSHALQAVFDDSNLDCKYERNWLRNQIIPAISKRHSAFAYNLIKTQNSLKQCEFLNHELANIDINNCEKNHNILIENLIKLNTIRQHNCLTYWLKPQVAILPDNKKLNGFLEQLKSYKPGLHPECKWHKYTLKVYDYKIYLIIDKVIQRQLVPTQIIFDADNSCAVTGQFKLVARKTSSIGLKSLDGISWVHFNNDFKKIKLANRSTKYIKNLLHENQIPPWQRVYYPLIVENNNIVYIPGVGCNAYTNRLVEKNGWVVDVFFYN